MELDGCRGSTRSSARPCCLLSLVVVVVGRAPQLMTWHAGGGWADRQEGTPAPTYWQLRTAGGPTGWPSCQCVVPLWMGCQRRCLHICHQCGQRGVRAA